MPIIYSHQMPERNPKPKFQPKYSKNQWVIFEGKHCQVKGFELQDGMPIYTLSLPSSDGLPTILIVHQQEISEAKPIASHEDDRAAHRSRLEAQNEKYKRL